MLLLSPPSILLLGCLSTSVSSATDFDLNNPAQGIISDYWWAIKVGGVKCGYTHETVERRGARVITKEDRLLEVKIGWLTHMRLRTRVEVVETLSGHPLSFTRTDARAQVEKTTQQDPDNPLKYTVRFALGDSEEPFMRVHGRFHDGKVTVTHEHHGLQREKTYGLDPEAKLTWGAYRFARSNNRVGASYTLKRFDADNPATPKTYTMKVVSADTVTIDGVDHPALKVTAHERGQLGGIRWYDHSGNLLMQKGSSGNLGFMTTVRCTQAEALSENGELTGVLKGTNIPVGRGIDLDVETVQRVTYRISATKEGVALPQIPQSPMQKVIPQEDGSIRVVVTRLKKVRGIMSRQAPVLPDREKYLEPTTVITADDPEVVKLARDAAGDAPDTRSVAERLCRFVDEYVQMPTIRSTPFASAAEVARTKRGDCTESAVLLAAMARARGIPSRLVGGWIYAPPEAAFSSGLARVLVPHCWTQLYIDGGWIDMDSALGETAANPARIAVSLDPPEDSEQEDAEPLALLLATGAAKLELLAVDDPGETQSGTSGPPG